MKSLTTPCFLALTAALPSTLQAKEVLKERTNVLIIMTDEHNLRTLGCYRQLMSADQAQVWGEGVIVETPHLDYLAANGILSLSSYAACPISGPTRSCFQTGLYAHQTGVPTNDLAMKKEVETFAEVLANNGYSTGYMGKWHLSGEGRPQWAPEEKFGWQDNRYMFNRGHWKKLSSTANGAQVGALTAKGNPSYEVDNADEKSFTTDFLCDRAIEFMEANKQNPFCCMISIPDPHGPNTVRKPYDTMFSHLTFKTPYTYTERGDHADASWEKPEGGFSSKEMQLYFGMVKCIDDNIGKLIEYLKTNGLFDNTLIVFTSDHGDLCGEHHRHNKSVPYEMSAKVPFIMHHPILIPQSRVDKTTFSSVDFKPTLLGLLDIKAKKASAGQDVSPYLLGKNRKKSEEITFIRSGTTLNAFTEQAETVKRTYWVAAVTPRYKLICTTGDTEATWLIDLEKDPNELKNLYNDAAHSKMVKQLAKALLKYGQSTSDGIITRSVVKEKLTAAIKR